MALKAVHVCDIPNLDRVTENASLVISSGRFFKGPEELRTVFKPSSFMVIGHRGSGMNVLTSSDRRMKAIKENSLLSFNTAKKPGVDFVEFDVQVTRDDCPVIFHDNFVLTGYDGSLSENRLTELTLADFLCYGPQREPGFAGKPLSRKSRDGRVFLWRVEDDDSLCTLQEAFQKVDSSLGFSVELKFDDGLTYSEEELAATQQCILRVVYEYSRGRPIIFSSFQPDVFFLTNGGSETYTDSRRNSLDEAIKLCIAGALHGIVSEVKSIFRNPAAIPRIKEANLGLVTYGQLNNVPEAVYMQCLMGVDGVIVDLVGEIAEVVLDFVTPLVEEEWEDGRVNKVIGRPKFSEGELSFLMKLIPKLIQ